MEPESESNPPIDEGNDELFYEYLAECTEHYNSMSFMESID